LSKHIGDGRYEVPVDLIAQGKAITKKINEREKKRFYPRLDVLSAKPVERLVDAKKKTWLDKELFKQSKGKPSFSFYDEQISEALEARKDWLVSHRLGFIQSNGQFALREGALLKLDKLEALVKGHELAEKLGISFNDRQVQEGQIRAYLGCVELGSGLWALMATEQALQMMYLKERPELERGVMVRVREIENGKFELHALAREQDRSKERSEDKEQEQDQERER